jgi:hypothetical protein
VLFSEQQYFNAMKRKGYNPQENDVPVILSIHNLVNEQGTTTSCFDGNGMNDVQLYLLVA